jgi:hypothetical protein
MSTVALRWAAVLFAGLALVAGGLQCWAYVATDGPRHLVLGIFAIAVGVSVLAALGRDFARQSARRRGATATDPGERGVNATSTANRDPR